MGWTNDDTDGDAADAAASQGIAGGTQARTVQDFLKPRRVLDFLQPQPDSNAMAGARRPGAWNGLSLIRGEDLVLWPGVPVLQSNPTARPWGKPRPAPKVLGNNTTGSGDAPAADNADQPLANGLAQGGAGTAAGPQDAATPPAADGTGKTQASPANPATPAGAGPAVPSNPAAPAGTATQASDSGGQNSGGEEDPWPEGAPQLADDYDQPSVRWTDSNGNEYEYRQATQPDVEANSRDKNPAAGVEADSWYLFVKPPGEAGQRVSHKIGGVWGEAGHQSGADLLSAWDEAGLDKGPPAVAAATLLQQQTPASSANTPSPETAAPPSPKPVNQPQPPDADKQRQALLTQQQLDAAKHAKKPYAVDGEGMISFGNENPVAALDQAMADGVVDSAQGMALRKQLLEHPGQALDEGRMEALSHMSGAQLRSQVGAGQLSRDDMHAVIRRQTGMAQEAADKRDNGVGVVKDFTTRLLAKDSELVNRGLQHVAHWVGDEESEEQYRQNADVMRDIGSGKFGDTNPAKDSLQAAGQWMEKPLMEIPTPSADFMKRHPYLGGALESGAEFASGFTSPANLLMMVATDGMGPAMKRLIDLGFKAQGARQIVDQAKALLHEEDPAKQSKLATAIILSLLFLSGKHEEVPGTGGRGLERPPGKEPPARGGGGTNPEGKPPIPGSAGGTGAPPSGPPRLRAKDASAPGQPPSVEPLDTRHTATGAPAFEKPKPRTEESALVNVGGEAGNTTPKASSSGGESGGAEGGGPTERPPDFTKPRPDAPLPKGQQQQDLTEKIADPANSEKGNPVEKPAVKWTSWPKFGHTFSEHGWHKLKDLIGSAKGENKDQGIWRNNQKAAEFLFGLNLSGRKVIDIEIPEGLGSYIKPDGSIMPAKYARVILSKTGIKTAFPISETIYEGSSNH